MDQTMNFRGIVEDMIRKLEEATEPGQTLGTSRADVRLVGQQYQEAKVGKFTLECHESYRQAIRQRKRNPTLALEPQKSYLYLRLRIISCEATLMGLFWLFPKRRSERTNVWLRRRRESGGNMVHLTMPRLSGTISARNGPGSSFPEQ